MIGALLSNTPANLLRSSGVAGEAEPGAGDSTPGRDRESARASLASAAVQSGQRRDVPVLTAQAVLALQSAEETGPGKRNAPGSGSQAPSEESDGPAKVQSRSTGGGIAPVSGQGDAALAPAETQSAEKEDTEGDGLNEAEEKQVQELAKRDREVRAHEQAHARVGGPYAGAPSYTFQQGPDGKRYAIGGEVQIDTAKEKTPQETIRKMQVVIRAALAPAEPSSQDMKVAQLARSQLSEAQAELRQQKADELQGGDDAETGPAAAGASAPGSPDAEANSGNATDKEQASDTRSSDAASAYQTAAQQTRETEALFASLLA